MDFYGIDHKAYELEQQEIAHGGEGAIYSIVNDNSIVAKIFYPAKSNGKEAKLITMIKQANPTSPTYNYFAWPKDVLYDKSGQFKGFIMPKLSSGKIDLKEAYLNRDGIRWGKYLQIAINLSAAVADAHDEDYIIGDLNPDNVKVDVTDATITLIDTDSYHIKDKKNGTIFPCTVCKPNFTAPEIQNAGDISLLDPTKSFSKETDNYALAILIYSTLLNGVHPFAFKFLSQGLTMPQLEDNMKNALCAQFTKSYHGESIDIPPQAPSIKHFPSKIQNMFFKAFIDGCSDPSARPSAKEWYYALKNMQKSLRSCDVDPTHEHCSDIGCPWCEAEKKLSIANANAAKQMATPASKYGISHSNNTLQSTSAPYSYYSPTSSAPSQNTSRQYTVSQNAVPPKSNSFLSDLPILLSFLIPILLITGLIAFGVSSLINRNREKHLENTHITSEQVMFTEQSAPAVTKISVEKNQRIEITVDKNTVSVNECSFEDISQFKEYINSNYEVGTKFAISTNHAVVDVYEQVKQTLDDLGFDYKE